VRALPPRRAHRPKTALDATLDALPSVLALHERRMRGANGRANGAVIDHLVGAPSGVWVVDAKVHYGPLEVRRSGGILSARVEQLFINNRDGTGFVQGLQRQVASVEAVLREAGQDVPVRGVMCFLGTSVPWVSEEIAGTPLVSESGLGAVLEAAGSYGAEERAAAVAVLASKFPPA
jgi:hypothetical protein